MSHRFGDRASLVTRCDTTPEPRARRNQSLQRGIVPADLLPLYLSSDCLVCFPDPCLVFPTVSHFSSTCLPKFPNHHPFFRLPLCANREVVAIAGGGWRGGLGQRRRMARRICRGESAAPARAVLAGSRRCPRQGPLARRGGEGRCAPGTVVRLSADFVTSHSLWSLARRSLARRSLARRSLARRSLDCAGGWNISVAGTGLERLEEILAKHRIGRTSPFRRVPPRV